MAKILPTVTKMDNAKWTVLPQCRADARGYVDRWTFYTLVVDGEARATVTDWRECFAGITGEVLDSDGPTLEFERLDQAKRAMEKIVKERMKIQALNG